ncbi:AlwI family type II restriction endonuclease [Trueperella pyogenes]|uniref:AlwI family type II restriction endonuclease n=1 Tax=Trueperella pyogenes TaxID=1661 RepID=UPI00324A9A5B
MRNTWWVTRPKRNLVSVPLCLKVLADVAAGRAWRSEGKHTELTIEQGLEDAGLKRPGRRRDQGGGGARTYRAWLKSLGLVFMDDADRLQLTCAGQALVEGQPPLPILSEQVYKYQFPSSFTYSGSSAVDPRFKVRPFVFLLQLLLDERLDGVLSEKDEIALIVLCYGTSNRQKTVDDVVERIVNFRQRGVDSLDADYVQRFSSSRSRETSFEKLAANLRDVANTCRNWLGFTQLIDVEAGMWKIADGAVEEAQTVVNSYATKVLIDDWNDEEKYQRRYGLVPGQRKDTRNLDGQVGAISAGAIEEMRVDHAYLGLASSKVIARISPEVVNEVATKTGISPARVEQVLTTKYPGGSAAWFMAQYVQLAFQSRERATEFEVATTAIFRDVFGFQAKHIGPIPRRPDIVIASEPANYGALLDSKAYRAGYSATSSRRSLADLSPMLA